MSVTPLIDLSPAGPTYSLAIDLVVVSILLSALALGIARAAGSRKLWTWGVDELAQSILNAALLGILVAWAAAASTAVSSSLPSSALAACPDAAHSANAPLSYSLCTLDNASAALSSVSSGLLSASYRLDMLAQMRLTLNVLSAAPFDALSWPAHAYADWAAQLAGLQSMLESQRQFLLLVASSAFGLFLPAGLMLRLFFATRKLGGALMAGAIGFFLVYPLAYSALTLSSPLAAQAAAATASLDQVSASLAALPQADLSKSGEMANLLLNLSGEDIAARAFLPYGSVSSFIGTLNLLLVFYPLIALVLTLISIRQLAVILGGEFHLDLFQMV